MFLMLNYLTSYHVIINIKEEQIEEIHLWLHLDLNLQLGSGGWLYLKDSLKLQCIIHSQFIDQLKNFIQSTRGDNIEYYFNLIQGFQNMFNEYTIRKIYELLIEN